MTPLQEKSNSFKDQTAGKGESTTAPKKLELSPLNTTKKEQNELTFYSFLYMYLCKLDY